MAINFWLVIHCSETSMEININNSIASKILLKNTTSYYVVSISTVVVRVNVLYIGYR